MTRFGLLSDIHGNFRRICIALQILEENGVDKVFHLGDLVDGPSDGAEKVIQLLSELGIEGVFGLHDYQELEDDRENLSDSSRKYIRKLPRKINFDDCLLVHDNPFLSWRYVKNFGSAKKIFKKFGNRLTILGHTHFASAFSEEGEEVFFEKPGQITLNPLQKYVLNPGSLGLPKDGPIYYGSFAIYDDCKRTFEVLRFM